MVCLFDVGGIGSTPSCEPSWTKRLFAASKADFSGGNIAGSKNRLLQAQGHEPGRPPAQCAVHARVVEEIERTDEVRSITFDKLRMLREEVMGRLEVMGLGEAARTRGRARVRGLCGNVKGRKTGAAPGGPFRRCSRSGALVAGLHSCWYSVCRCYMFVFSVFQSFIFEFVRY